METKLTYILLVFNLPPNVYTTLRWYMFTEMPKKLMALEFKSIVESLGWVELDGNAWPMSSIWQKRLCIIGLKLNAVSFRFTCHMDGWFCREEEISSYFIFLQVVDYVKKASILDIYLIPTDFAFLTNPSSIRVNFKSILQNIIPKIKEHGPGKLKYKYYPLHLEFQEESRLFLNMSINLSGRIISSEHIYSNERFDDLIPFLKQLALECSQ